ncbi:MAG TPA: toprim domain-containing protein [Beijerinckiaceae bacterium]|nr:toprim domain-containing protein [Beijerinckiaceae bacterium]
MADIVEIKRALESQAFRVAEHLLPRGVLKGKEWCVGSVQGEPGESLKIHISGSKAGVWCDFAEGGEGGDIIDLWRDVRGLNLASALDEIRAWLGIASPEFEKDKRKTWRRPERPKCVVPKSAVRDYLLTQRKLSEAALAAYRIGENDRTIVLPSLNPEGELCFVKYLDVDRPDGKKKTWVEKDCEPILFGWQAIDQNAREVTLTEGEVDAMSAYDFGYPALSVPFGGGKGDKQRWIECEFERMSRFEVIYLALDMDDEGNAAVQEIAARLGHHRCRRVQLPKKDINECRKAGISADEIRKCFEGSETLDPEELRRAGSYTDAVIELFWPKEGEEPGYQLPFARIKGKLRFRPGEMTLWTGATGSGKSQLLSYGAICWGEQGARVCIASFEMAPKQTLRRMVKQATNTDRPTEAFVKSTMKWMDEWLWLFNVVGKSDVARVLEIFEYARCRYGCDTFIIDSLMRLGVKSEDYEAQEQAIFEIVSWSISKNVHVHLVAHARKGMKDSGVQELEDVKGASEIASNAFNVLAVWRNKRHEDELRQTEDLVEKGDESAQVRLDELREKPGVILNIAKQRNGDFDGKIGLWFIQRSYQYRCSWDSAEGKRFVDLDPQFSNGEAA